MDFDERAMLCAAKLGSYGMLGYRPVAAFDRRFLDTDAVWFRVAAFGAPAPGKISPRLTIFRRDVQ